MGETIPIGTEWSWHQLPLRCAWIRTTYDKYG